MGLVYTAPFRALTLGANSAAQQDIFELWNNSGRAIRILHWQISSQYNVDERIDLQVFTRTAVGSGGSSAVTPNPRNPLNTKASGITSFKTMIAGTVGTGGVAYEAYQWSQLERLDSLFIPEDGFELPSGFSYCLNNNNTFVASNRVISGFVDWTEN